jgi:hypothetical protein
MSKIYIDKDDFREEVIKSQDNKQVTDKLASYFVNIAKLVLTSFRMHPIDKEDSISYIINSLFKYYVNYKRESSSNCFNYFLTIAKYELTKNLNRRRNASIMRSKLLKCKI